MMTMKVLGITSYNLGGQGSLSEASLESRFPFPNALRNDEKDFDCWPGLSHVSVPESVTVGAGSVLHREMLTGISTRNC